MRRWLELAADGTLGRSIDYADRQVLFERGEAADAAFLLADGYIEIYQQVESGQSMVVRVLAAPCLFGTLETCAGEPHWLESMRALDHAVVHRVELDALHALLRDDRLASLECLGSTAVAFCRVAVTETSRFVGTDAMLAAMLLVWLELFGQPAKDGELIRLRRSQVELAGTVGTSERHIQRLLAAWKESGAVSRRHSRTVVHDRAFLAEMAAGFDEGLLHRELEAPGWVYGG